TRRPALGRHEAEARARLHAGALARPAAARRAHRRCRSLVAARTVGHRAPSGATGRPHRAGEHLLPRRGGTLRSRGGPPCAQGAPADITAAAERRTYLAEPGEHHTGRALQARLLGDPAIVDAVPEAGHVRVVRATTSHEEVLANDGPLAGIRVTPVRPRFEDGFMVLLHAKTGRERGTAMALDHVVESQNGEFAVEVHDLVRRFGAFTAVDHVSFNVRRG